MIPKKVALVLFLLLVNSLYALQVKYEVHYGFFPAGIIEIDFQNEQVVVKGKSSGILGWFYKYRLYMVFNLKNPEKSFLIEDENGKHRELNYNKILHKKAWLPLVIKILLSGVDLNKLKTIKVANYRIILQKREENNYTFKVEGSKRVRKIQLLEWKKGFFPKKIVIETSGGTLVLEKT